MPNMTAAQEAAYSAANTSQTFDAADTQFLFVGIAVVLLLSWWVWMTVQAYHSLSEPNTTAMDAGAKGARAGFLEIFAIAMMTF